ncbi:primosomal protein N' [Endozoicomonas sp. OPT23]|uniref:primosomal protein N' n=1 Tax=Endozoicomonas sp. OPT23 TaxID=2072845 RepID=UPI00129BC2CA|nr:primosomal protein N' [Endozoicomonas sp. OPT23]MRI32127.1 primosomal protein N' [Endozoicomonas sp. OPT23]
MTTSEETILSVAIPSPLRRMFDYLPPAECHDTLESGMRVQVTFGRRKVTGIIEAIKYETDCPREKLKSADNLLEPYQLLPDDIMKLCRWAASYYHYSLGETFSQALPKALRQGKPASQGSVTSWRCIVELDTVLKASLKRARKQLAAMEWLQLYPEGVSEPELKEAGFSKSILSQLEKKRLIQSQQVEITDRPFYELKNKIRQSHLKLNEEQQFALNEINETPTFNSVLLDGITGSGKTEVYLQAIAKTLEAGKQALVLVPEIGLTPQTVRRFRSRFGVPVACLHSGLSDSERLQGWLAASRENAGVLIATRSGIFTPLPKLGLIIVDEEHDNSYKQQDTLRYNARDLAIYRAKLANCPVILGSATPSLETLSNAQSGKYLHLKLRQRAGNAKPPAIELLDLRQQALQEGFAHTLIEQMQTTLLRDEQVMVFLNRRGYAPSLICNDCGEISDCPHCDAHLTLHRQPAHMHCHHCDYQMAIPWTCSNCNGRKLQPSGQGTERCEQTLEQLFPDFPVIRIDRDSTRKKNALHEILEVINEGEPSILLGTQMLAKGHHFPNVTLVAILNADSGLFSSDFRGLEKTGQLIMQVSGRAGRGDKPGKVLIQTYNPQNPSLQLLASNNYPKFAASLFNERQQLNLPPVGYLALFRAESATAAEGINLLKLLRSTAEPFQQQFSSVRALGPLPAPMEKRQGRYRYQLMIHSLRRSDLHRLLSVLIQQLDSVKLPRTLRWNLDVDPQDMT